MQMISIDELCPHLYEDVLLFTKRYLSNTKYPQNLITIRGNVHKDISKKFHIDSILRKILKKENGFDFIKREKTKYWYIS